MHRVLIPLPSEDFEPTEAAVPWKCLRDAGIEVVFATPDGRPARCDEEALEGVVFGQIGATSEDAALYREMARDEAFLHPIRYDAIDVESFDAVHLPGGHAPGMRPYLESEVLQSRLAEFFRDDKPVSAVCHGPVLLARTKDPATGKSVLEGRRLTALTKLLERSGYWLTVWTLGKRFRTYPAYVQDEVIEAVGDRWGRCWSGWCSPGFPDRPSASFVLVHTTTAVRAKSLGRRVESGAALDRVTP